MQLHNFIGPWGEAKRSNIINFQLLSQFQIFLNQSLCVFSQMKDVKHIRRNFHSVALVMPQVWDFGGTGGLGVNSFPKFNQIGCVSDSHEWQMQRHEFFGPLPGALGSDQKVKDH